MKKLFLFLSMACAISLVSCSDDDDDNGGGATGSITVTATPSAGVVGDTFTFVVEDESEADVTSDASLYVDGTAIEGDTYTPEAAGTYTITATLGSLEATTSILVDEAGGGQITLPEVPEGSGTLTVDGTEYSVDVSYVTLNGYYEGTNIAQFRVDFLSDTDQFTAIMNIDHSNEFIPPFDFQTSYDLEANTTTYYGYAFLDSENPTFLTAPLNENGNLDIENSYVTTFDFISQNTVIIEQGENAMYASGTWDVSVDLTMEGGDADEVEVTYSGGFLYVDGTQLSVSRQSSHKSAEELNTISKVSL